MCSCMMYITHGDLCMKIANDTDEWKLGQVKIYKRHFGWVELT